MIALVIIFLVAMYILKIFFPQEFVLSIQTKNLVAFGDYIDNHEWAYWICTYITSFVTYWLYCCACSRKWYLKWHECLYILITITIVRVLTILDSNLSTIISALSFIILPALMKSKLTDCAIIYTIHSIAQGLSLSIRNLVIYLKSVNVATILVLIFECYLWLVLLYLLFNFKKEGKENENGHPTIR